MSVRRARLVMRHDDRLLRQAVIRLFAFEGGVTGLG
jgi:hypothetical protein